MRRVLILGCPGSGKSHFARRLADITGLPLHYLDLLWHKPDRTTFSQAEFDLALVHILEEDRWILDGNYQRTLPKRLARCDTVFLFDLSLADCLAGAVARIGHKRPDLPWLETELGPEFRDWIINFKQDRLPGILALLAETNCAKIIFKSHAEADAYLRGLAKGK